MRMIMGVVLGLSLSACSTAEVAKEKHVVAMLLADGRTIVVTGCQDAPTITADAAAVMALVPPLTVYMPTVKVADDLVEKVCAAVLPPKPLPQQATTK